MGVIGEIHSQSGPIFQAIALSLCTDAAFKANLEATFADHPFDASSSTAERPQRCVVLESSNAGIATASDTTSSTFEIPNDDLVSMLPSDWHSKIVSLLQCLSTCCESSRLIRCVCCKQGAKEGKTAWKTRKEAMDDLEKAINSCNGLLETSNLKPIIDLLRALRERLSDSQSNLKPIAAKLIGSILSKTDKNAQANLGKVIFPAIVNSALNDIKKPMRDASLAAVRSGTTLNGLEGGGPNGPALGVFLAALVSGLDGSEFKVRTQYCF